MSFVVNGVGSYVSLIQYESEALSVYNPPIEDIFLRFSPLKYVSKKKGLSNTMESPH